jgi:rhodanese-related sulfurtransferase
MMRFILFPVILLTMLHVAGCAQSAKNTLLPPAEFQKELSESKDALLIDVRTPAEFAAGHLPGAVNINFNSPDFKAQIGKLDKHKPVFVYCAVGGRSGSATSQMSAMGFPKIVDMQGGINAWKSAGKTVEK